MPENPVIECKPSKWFKIRAVLVLLMLAFFTLWFVKDGYSGYRQKNLEYVTHQLFSEKKDGQDDYVVNAIELFNAKEYTADTWAAFASAQTLPVPKEERGLLPRDFDYSTKWPEEIVNGYDELKDEKPYELWKKYSGKKGWSMEGPEKLYDEGKIREQFIVAGICALLFLYAAFVCIRIMGRTMAVTETSYIAPGGNEIPFTSMRKIDKRKWDNKGLALIHYEQDGSVKKAKVDGMVYGQFQPENGAPAEALFAHVMDHFKGEVVEYVEEEEEPESEEGASSKPVNDSEKVEP